MSIFKKCKDLKNALRAAGLPYEYRGCDCCGAFLIPRQNYLNPFVCQHCVDYGCLLSTNSDGMIINHKPRHEIRIFHCKDYKAKYQWPRCHYIGIAIQYVKNTLDRQNPEDEVSNHSVSVGSFHKQPPDGKYSAILYETTAVVAIHRGIGKVAVANDYDSLRVLEDPTKWEPVAPTKPIFRR